jgi:hypothetical protein
VPGFEIFRMPLQRKEQHSKPENDNIQLVDLDASRIQRQPRAQTPQPRQFLREISAFLFDPDDTEGYLYAILNTVVQVVGQVMVKMYILAGACRPGRSISSALGARQCS